MYGVTVALNKPWSVVGFVLISDPQDYVNRQGTTALGAIESDEPSLAAVVTTSHVHYTLVNNTESSVILGFSKLTILQQLETTIISMSVQKRTDLEIDVCAILGRHAN